jgi:hypothetical protein
MNSLKAKPTHLRHYIEPLDDRCAVQKGRNRPPRLTETQAKVETQYQLQEQRLSASTAKSTG